VTVTDSTSTSRTTDVSGREAVGLEATGTRVIVFVLVGGTCVAGRGAAGYWPVSIPCVAGCDSDDAPVGLCGVESIYYCTIEMGVRGSWNQRLEIRIVIHNTVVVI